VILDRLQSNSAEAARVSTPDISYVVPAFNECESIPTLFAEITTAASQSDKRVEIIFVDDGSTDGTAKVLAGLSAEHSNVKVITFRRNFGKSAALDAGFRAADGDIIITMDADLQDDPAETLRFIEKLDEGFDVVSGWKAHRLDPIDKTAPSKVFNFVVSRLSGVKLRDFNCGFKAYRAEAVRGLALYGELHRFIPVLLHWRGFSIGEMAVNHRARKFGKSKFGASRLFKGAMDLLTVILNTRYQTRPLHVFGGVGALFGLVGALILTYLTVLWIAGAGPIGQRPLFFLGILLTLSSFQFFTVGLLGEFIQRQSQGVRQAYFIRSTTNIGNEDVDAFLGSSADILRQTANLIRNGDPAWARQLQAAQQPSATTPPSATEKNMPTQIRSSG
jgi:glycosyltransferase involved in cell wall biosynthesis